MDAQQCLDIFESAIEWVRFERQQDRKGLRDIKKQRFIEYLSTQAATSILPEDISIESNNLVIKSVVTPESKAKIEAICKEHRKAIKLMIAGLISGRSLDFNEVSNWYLRKVEFEDITKTPDNTLYRARMLAFYRETQK